MLFGATGPILRGSGCMLDLRFSTIESYAAYRLISFRSYLGVQGDSFDRFLVRSRELFESMNIIYTVMSQLYGKTNVRVNAYHSSEPAILRGKHEFKTKMESLIVKFKSAIDPISTDSALSYRSVEAGKGEFGVMLIASNDRKPYRVYLRSPAYNHLQLLSLLGSGHMFADIVTLVGTLDLVFGEVDR
jgi:NADH-quinone oxidoreductase subunit D